VAPRMRDLVVFAAGGGMRGIFGAGAFHAMSAMAVRGCAHAIYGISAGALNAAHLALGSTMQAMEWYLQYVPEHGLLAHATPVALIRGEDVVDMPGAGRVLEAEHLVDGDALARCPIPVSFGVVDREALGFRWIDARRPDAIRVLLASSSVFPFVRDGVVIDGVSYIDGGYRESVCHTRLRREHPGAKLLLVLNDNERESIVRRMVVSAVLRRRDERLAEIWLDTLDRGPAELEQALCDPDTFVVRPDVSFPVEFATTDPAVLAHGFWLGYKAVLTQRDRVMRFLDA
jgi:predicted patatin/cPLA2 family phospholipase